MKKRYTHLEVGKRLKELRKKISQKEFAKKIDVPIASYQRYEYGETLPPEPVLKRIAEICNITIDEILGRDPFASLKRLFDKERQEISVEKAESAAYWETIREKMYSKMGIPVPENVGAFLEMVTFYNKHGINIVDLIKGAKEPIYAREEQELFDKLYAILRGKNKDNRKAIIENVNAFYKTRNVESEEDDCGEGELKKTKHAG